MGIKSINEPDGPGHTAMLTPNSLNEPVTVDDPVITALEPDSCTIADADFTLHISGTGFYPFSVIFFAGHDEPTTLNEDGTLSTVVKPSLWAEPAMVECQVRNGDLYSNAAVFTFEEAPARSSDRENVSHETRGRHGAGGGHRSSGRHSRR